VPSSAAAKEVELKISQEMLRTGNLVKAWKSDCELADAQLEEEGAKGEMDG